MSRIAYVNGHYVSHRDASVHVEDRGYQFADGVYEVCEVSDGALIDMTRHLDRLGRSLSELSIAWPMDRRALEQVMRQVVSRNRVENGMIYLQVTRGVARRDHPFPPASVKPAIVITAKRIDPRSFAAKAEKGIGVITVPENRWDRVDIKTIGLLPNVLAKQKAMENGAGEAWFVDPDGTVKEGSATNAWIVTMEGVLVTRPADHGILRGITRTTAMDAIAALGLKVEERAFTVEEAQNAKEAFITSATSLVMPIIAINGKSVGNGHPGDTTLTLRKVFHKHAQRTAISV